jgi:hypothetical protein
VKLYAASLLFGIFILIIILNSRNSVSISDPAKVVTPVIAQQLSSGPKNKPAFNPSNHTEQFNEPRNSEKARPRDLKNIVKAAHPAAEQLADLLLESGFTQQEAAQIFVSVHNDLGAIRQIEDIVATEWTKITAGIVELEQRTDLTEARKRQEYFSAASGLSSLNIGMRGEQSKIRERLLETVGIPRSAELDPFRTQLLSIFPRGPLPDTVIQELQNTTQNPVKRDSP